jgi:hypothetical protein
VTMRSPIRLLLAGLLGMAAAALVSCGSSGKGLIPSQDAGPLQGDFQAIAQAAQEGNGSCAATEAAIDQTERDFRALPASVDPGLHGRLAEGITNLSSRARELCTQPLAGVTTTTTEPPTETGTTPPSTATQTTPTTGTETTPTTSTPTTSQPPSEEGGTAAPSKGGEGRQPSEGGAGGSQGEAGGDAGASEGTQSGGGITGGSGGEQ